MDISKIVARVKNILLSPKTEWPVVAAEPDSVAAVYKNYIIYIAALTPVATFIGLALFGIHLPLFGTVHPGVGHLLAQLVLSYAAALALTYIMAHIINALAPSFGASPDLVQALKTAAYSITAVWVVGILNILPGFGALAFLATLAAVCYAVYLLYLGLPHTMKAPPEKAGGYAAAAVIIGLIIGIVFGAIIGQISGVAGFGGTHDSTSFSADKSSPLGALVAMGQHAAEEGKKMEEAEKSGDANAQAAAASKMVGAILGGGDKVEALNPDALKAFVPATLGGLPQTSFETNRQAPIGIQVSNAKATYRNPQGGPELHLEITDTGGAKGIMALAGFAGMDQEKQDNNGYEKTWHQDGRMIHEQWNKSGSGEYTVVLGDRFVVEVNGSGVANIDTIKAAAASINLAGLEALKGQGVSRN
ncbi:MAG: Yip1 family protein [Rudaea sp.]